MTWLCGVDSACGIILIGKCFPIFSTFGAAIFQHSIFSCFFNKCVKFDDVFFCFCRISRRVTKRLRILRYIFPTISELWKLWKKTLSDKKEPFCLTLSYVDSLLYSYHFRFITTAVAFRHVLRQRYHISFHLFSEYRGFLTPKSSEYQSRFRKMALWYAWTMGLFIGA